MFMCSYILILLFTIVLKKSTPFKRDGSFCFTGAGLDVFEKGPEIHPGLLGLQNVVLTPHAGSSTVATREKRAVMAVENLIAGVTGGRYLILLIPRLS